MKLENTNCKLSMKLQDNDLTSKKTLNYTKNKDFVFLGCMRSIPQTMIPKREKWGEKRLLWAFLEYIIITTMPLLELSTNGRKLIKSTNALQINNTKIGLTLTMKLT